jgi:hypothetical protein
VGGGLDIPLVAGGAEPAVLVSMRAMAKHLD